MKRRKFLKITGIMAGSSFAGCLGGGGGGDNGGGNNRTDGGNGGNGGSGNNSQDGSNGTDDSNDGGGDGGDGADDSSDDGGDGTGGAQSKYPNYSWSKLGDKEPTATTKVDLEGFQFKPMVAKVEKGTEVKFVNKDSSEHTITIPKLDVDMSLSGGGSTTVTFDKTGTFDYVCTFHPPDMLGRIKVVETMNGGGGMTSSLSVKDQTTDGSSVKIPEASIDKKGWLVVHPKAEGGGPNGKVVLGKMMLDPQSGYSDITLNLDESVTEDQVLFAMLHYDDPNDGKFTFPANGDPPVTVNGDPLVKPFQVSVSGMSDGGNGNGGSKKTVEMKNTSFTPLKAQISPGTTVEWVNKDGYPHDVTSAQFHDVAETWDFQKNLGGGEKTSYTFDKKGIYEYYCTIHGKGNMCGAILVGDVSLDKSLPCESGGGDGYGGDGDDEY